MCSIAEDQTVPDRSEWGTLITAPLAALGYCVSHLPSADYNRTMADDSTGRLFEKLVGIMATLRGPNGCPWDKEQDFNTLKPMLVEEVYEVLEAIDNQDFDGVSEELGDLMLHIVFQAQLGKEQGKFDI